jgi:ribosomal protein L37AE/L43A
MPITWENIAKLKYSFKVAKWRDKQHNRYIFKPACANCGEPFLSRVSSKGFVCSNKCKFGSICSGYKDGRCSDRSRYYAQWASENRDKKNAAESRRRARKLEQTPSDASEKKIAWFFQVATNLTEATGEPWHVDHIQPLAHGGLHHENNLQVLSGSENMQKGDKVGVSPTGITIEVYNSLMAAFDFLYSIACPKK